MPLEHLILSGELKAEIIYLTREGKDNLQR